MVEKQRDRIAQSNQAIVQQFAANAQKYETSEVHARGDDLDWMVQTAALTGVERVLDVGTGTGHTALAFASCARTVMGIDLTPRMIQSADLLAEQKDVRNVQFVVSDVVRMPFPDATFDVVTCRLAAHHFADADGAAAEIARVMRPGGQFLLVDHVAPTNPDLDRFINRIDWLRDASHVREWTIPEWVARFAQVGVDLSVVREWNLRLDYAWWIRQAATPDDGIVQIDRMFREANAEIRATFEVEYGEGGTNRDSPVSFALKAVLLQGVKRV